MMHDEMPITILSTRRHSRRSGLAFFFCLIMDELFGCGFLHIDDGLLMLFVAHYYDITLVLPTILWSCQNEYANRSSTNACNSKPNQIE